jgi:hypothetical protein
LMCSLVSLNDFVLIAIFEITKIHIRTVYYQGYPQRCEPGMALWCCVNVIPRVRCTSSMSNN